MILLVSAQISRTHYQTSRTPFTYSFNPVTPEPSISLCRSLRLCHYHQLMLHGRMCTRMVTLVRWVNCTAQPKHEKTEYNIIPCNNPTAPGHTIKDSHTGASTRKGGICPRC